MSGEAKDTPIGAALAVVAVLVVASTAILVIDQPLGADLVAELPKPIAEAISHFVALRSTQVLSAHIVLNWFVALFAAAESGLFEVKRIADFLWSKIVPLIGVYFLSLLLGGYLDAAWLSGSTFVVLELRLWADLVGNLKIIGVPIPDSVSGMFEKP